MGVLWGYLGFRDPGSGFTWRVRVKGLGCRVRGT